jgi:Mg2+-importing ATPase
MNHVENVPARLRQIATATPLELFRQLDASPKGLLEADAAQRLAQWGDNRVRTDTQAGVSRHLAESVRSPFVGLLALLCAVFGVLGDVRGAATVTVMVGLSVAMRVWAGARSERAVHALTAQVSNTCTVRRRASDGSAPACREVPVTDVVPGDVLLLAPGDVIAADVRLLGGRDLVVDQSSVSGEALPVPKTDASSLPGGTRRPAGRRAPRERDAADSFGGVDSPAMCLAGTSVVSGSATALVIATGSQTYLGWLAARPQVRAESSFELGVRAVGWTLVRFMFALVPVVVLVTGAMSRDWTRAVMFAVAVAVALTPEMLPVIVTTNLARGAWRLARRAVIVKRLNAIQDLGAVDVVCVDKTGTLTEDRVAFAHSVDPDGRPDAEAAEYAHLALHFQIAPHDRLDRAIWDQLRTGGLREETGTSGFPDRARELGAEIAEPDEVLLDSIYSHLDEIGFDPHRRRSSVVLSAVTDDHLLITKGDPDVVLKRCARWGQRGTHRDISESDRARFHDLISAHAKHGMRMLAVAVKQLPARLESYGDDDETGLSLVGFIGFVDPVATHAGEAVDALTRHGVAVKILTGDHPQVARHVAGQIGLPAGQVVLGSRIDRTSEAGLRVLAEKTTVFARLTSEHKTRIVGALRSNGHAVGFVGDGVNDAPALRLADVGIAADSATDVAKDAADLILLDKNLGVLAAGIVEGRRTLGNTLKYVHITASSNLGNVLSVVVASVFLPFVPMLPIQLVAQNLLYDGAQLALPWDRVGRGYLERPRRWDAAGLVRFMVVFGPLSSLFDLMTFVLLWRVFGAVDQPALFRTGWFLEGLCSQLTVVFLLRTAAPIWRAERTTRPARPVALAGAAAAITGLLLPIGPWAAALGMRALPVGYLLWLVTVVLGYALAVELVKRRCLHRHQLW